LITNRSAEKGDLPYGQQILAPRAEKTGYQSSWSMAQTWDRTQARRRPLRAPRDHDDVTRWRDHQWYPGDDACHVHTLKQACPENNANCCLTQAGCSTGCSDCLKDTGAGEGEAFGA